MAGLMNEFPIAVILGSVGDRSLALDLDFRTVLASIVTLTRASSGTRFDSLGVSKTMGNDVARLDHDVTNSNAPLGLRVEGARTNMEQSSEVIDEAGGITTANVGVAPDGNTTAELATDDDDASVEWGNSQFTGGLNGGGENTAHSIFLKYVSGHGFYLSSDVFNSPDQWKSVVMDLNGAGQILGAEKNRFGGGATAATDLLLAKGGDGWFRFGWRHSDNTRSNFFHYFSGCYNNTYQTAQLDVLGEGSFHQWGMMMEEGVTFPSTYIKSPGTPTARAADIVSMAFAPGSEFTWVFEGRTPTGWDAAQVLGQFDDDGGTPQDNSVRVERNGSDELHLIVEDGGVTQADITIGTVADDTDFKIAVRIKANDFHAALNGTLASTPDTSGTVDASLSKKYFGQSDGGDHWFGTIAGEKVFKIGKDNAFLQGAST